MSKITTIWTYQLNNVQTEFAVNFDYLSRKFVQVTLIGKDRKVLRMNVDYRFIGPKMIKTTKAWGSSDGYQYLEIRRVTSATDSIVDFSDGSILRAGDLTIANLQSMHIAEEARNLAGDALGVNDDGQLDARARRIVNLGDPIGRKDAVNKAYVDDAKDSVIDSRDKALQYRNEAETFKNQANTFRGQAESAKDRAITAESNARSSASSSQSYKDQAATQASKAAESMASAQKSASNAVTSEKKAKASETEAAGSAKRAEDAAAKAVGGGLPTVGGTMTGPIEMQNNIITRGNYRLEWGQAGVDNRVGFYRKADSDKALTYFRRGGYGTLDIKFPEKSGTIAISEETVKKSGDSMTGSLTVPSLNIKSSKSEYLGVSIHNKSGRRLIIEGGPDREDRIGNIIYRYYAEDGSTKNEAYITIPKNSGQLALTSDFVPKTGGKFKGDLEVEMNNFANISLTSSDFSKRWFISNESGDLYFYRRQYPYSETDFIVTCPNKAGTLALTEDVVTKSDVRHSFRTVWSGSSNNVTIPLSTTYGVEVIIYASGYTFSHTLHYASDYMKFLDFYDVGSNSYIETTHDATNIYIKGVGVYITKVDIRETMAGRPL